MDCKGKHYFMKFRNTIRRRNIIEGIQTIYYDNKESIRNLHYYKYGNW